MQAETLDDVDRLVSQWRKLIDDPKTPVRSKMTIHGLIADLKKEHAEALKKRAREQRWNAIGTILANTATDARNSE